MESELQNFEEWFRKYGEYILKYEESKITVRLAWVTRIMLDEGYALFPGREESVKNYIAAFWAEKLPAIGLDPRLITKGDLKGTRQDVIDVLTMVFPNMQQQERPSLLKILQEEQVAVEQTLPFLPSRLVVYSRIRPLIALTMTILLSALMIILLSR